MYSRYAALATTTAIASMRRPKRFVSLSRDLGPRRLPNHEHGELSANASPSIRAASYGRIRGCLIWPRQQP